MAADKNETVEQIADQLKAIERAHKRTDKLITELHEMLAEAVKEHGESIGISPAGIAPKVP
jgi:hypothetical protein